MTAPADRNLLFGLLALQNGMIDQSVLVAAFHAWTRDKKKTIAEILLGLGAIDADDRTLLEGLVTKHLKRHGDDVEESLAAVPAPRSVVNGLVAIGDADVNATIGHVGSGSHPTEPERAVVADSTASMGRSAGDGQRFRVLRPHARGGLGAVFVALDAELNREVALKQILDHHADDPNSRTRFVLEAEITGGLEHPGIVPVYGLGASGDGRPYYAMRFIRGESLKDAVAAFHADPRMKGDPGRRSLGLRKLLRRFVDVCNAIEYAHTRGVIHRDIKPANIIVGKYGETLVVDWGLAKAMGKAETASPSDERTLMPSSASGSAETLPGSALGTPAFMSPEQAAGDLDRLGPRSDVYSLGATLYTLLTGKPPFEGDDLGVVLRAVGKGDFPRPRSVDPSIDAALEAVCLKAMATTPDDRYASCRALADDVERWAADEPTSAWPEPFMRRARRWAKRNRTAVTGAAVALVAGIVGLSAVLAVQTRANAALTSANTRLELSNRREVKANADLKAANERERARFGLAMEAIRTFHSGVSDDILLKQNEFQALRTRLLHGAREFYQKLEGLLEGQTDRESRRALASAYYEVGSLAMEIDTLREAFEAQRRALALFEDLAREDPSDAGVRHALGRTWTAVGLIHVRQDGEFAGATLCFEKAREALGAAVATRPGDVDARADLAKVLGYIADHPAINGEKNLEAVRQARDTWEALYRDYPGLGRVRLGFTSSLDNVASSLRSEGRFDEALSEFAHASVLGEALVRDEPGNPLYGHELIRTLGNMAGCLVNARRYNEATAAIDRAREVIATMAAANPTMHDFQRDLAWVEMVGASILIQTRRHDEALPALDRALAAREVLLKLNPNEVRHQQQRVLILRTQSFIHANAGRRARARPLSERAVALLEQLFAANPGRRDVRDDLTRGYSELGDLETADGHADEARAWFEKARLVVQKPAEADPSDRSARLCWADALRRIGTTIQASGRPADAIASYRRSLTILEGQTAPTGVELYAMACCHSLIAGATAEPGSGLTAAEGRAEAERAVALVRDAFKRGYVNLDWVCNTDSDLKAIRPRPDFQLLMMDLAFPTAPFAGGR